MPSKPWKLQKPLFRGDSASSVSRPNPEAPKNIVRHIMYYEGAGRETPYLSTSEQEDLARHFAGRSGVVWQTTVTQARAHKVTHISKTELMALLDGKGKGRATWPSALIVAQARRYVEQWAEHLLDFSDLDGGSNLEQAVSAIFAPPKGRKP